MNLQGIAPGSRLVTASGDIAELLEVTGGGTTARVRYVEVISDGAATMNSEAMLHSEDVITVEGTRFVGPGRTASTSAS